MLDKKLIPSALDYVSSCIQRYPEIKKLRFKDAARQKRREFELDKLHFYRELLEEINVALKTQAPTFALRQRLEKELKFDIYKLRSLIDPIDKEGLSDGVAQPVSELLSKLDSYIDLAGFNMLADDEFFIIRPGGLATLKWKTAAKELGLQTENDKGVFVVAPREVVLNAIKSNEKYHKMLISRVIDDPRKPHKYYDDESKSWFINKRSAHYFHFHSEDIFKEIKIAQKGGQSIIEMLQNCGIDSDAEGYSLAEQAADIIDADCFSSDVLAHRFFNEIAVAASRWDFNSISIWLFTGVKGTGKSELFKNICDVFFSESQAVIDSAGKTDFSKDYNSIFVGKRLIVIEELSKYSKADLYKQLEDVVTKNRMIVSEKWEKDYVAPVNFMVVLSTNDEHPMHISYNDRRVRINYCKDYKLITDLPFDFIDRPEIMKAAIIILMHRYYDADFKSSMNTENYNELKAASQLALIAYFKKNWFIERVKKERGGHEDVTLDAAFDAMLAKHRTAPAEWQMYSLSDDENKMLEKQEKDSNSNYALIKRFFPSLKTEASMFCMASSDLAKLDAAYKLLTKDET